MLTKQEKIKAIYEKIADKTLSEGCKFIDDLGKTKSHDYMLCNMKGKDFEIVGNIYENPELIN